MEAKQHQGPESVQGPVDLPGTETLLSPFFKARLQLPQPSLSSKGWIPAVANHGRSSQELSWGKIKETREAHQD